jgi:hypothetical protein
MILSAAVTAREIQKWCRARRIKITIKELRENFNSSQLQVMRRATCFHGVMARELGRYLSRRYEAARTRAVRHTTPRQLMLPQFKMPAANNRSSG